MITAEVYGHTSCEVMASHKCNGLVFLPASSIDNVNGFRVT
jgi:hypothetical protein